MVTCHNKKSTGVTSNTTDGSIPFSCARELVNTVTSPWYQRTRNSIRAATSVDFYFRSV